MTIITHDGSIHIAYTGPYPWADGAFDKARAGIDGYELIEGAPDAEYYEGDDIADWDTETGTRLVQRVIPEVVLTEEQQLTNEAAGLSAYLASTDWYAVRYAETGTKIPEEIKTARASARSRISEIRALLDTTTTAEAATEDIIDN